MSIHRITPRGFIRYFLAAFQIFCGWRAMDLCWDAVQLLVVLIAALVGGV